ncbi:zinc-finger domain-containing protein [Chelativorans sp. Marseille-P2723]|uniref:zinc-finger domain-containing protein n=1 Tax=Chelativorans sp. Marseille-P2723 TaxID=2709133 RepID=UPI00156DFB92|nr:zinc-finger domain-containing protein [Chelativorans sp. Marseille-P2723]
MAGDATPHFHNTEGHRSIEIGVKEFMCMGALPPNDHPHIFLDMGEDEERICPYCSTLYRYNPKLNAHETVPPGGLFEDGPA